jgi:hypothetical protein
LATCSGPCSALICSIKVSSAKLIPSTRMSERKLLGIRHRHGSAGSSRPDILAPGSLNPPFASARFRVRHATSLLYDTKIGPAPLFPAVGPFRPSLLRLRATLHKPTSRIEEASGTDENSRCCWAPAARRRPFDAEPPGWNHPGIWSGRYGKYAHGAEQGCCRCRRWSGFVGGWRCGQITAIGAISTPFTALLNLGATSDTIAVLDCSGKSFMKLMAHSESRRTIMEAPSITYPGRLQKMLAPASLPSSGRGNA